MGEVTRGDSYAPGPDVLAALCRRGARPRPRRQLAADGRPAAPPAGAHRQLRARPASTSAGSDDFAVGRRRRNAAGLGPGLRAHRPGAASTADAASALPGRRRTRSELRRPDPGGAACWPRSFARAIDHGRRVRLPQRSRPRARRARRRRVHARSGIDATRPTAATRREGPGPGRHRARLPGQPARPRAASCGVYLSRWREFLTRRAARGQQRGRRLPGHLRHGGHDADHVPAGGALRRAGRALPARVRQGRAAGQRRAHLHQQPGRRAQHRVRRLRPGLLLLHRRRRHRRSSSSPPSCPTRPSAPAASCGPR